MKRKYELSLLRVKKYIEENKYKGYDPYDTLNSYVPFHWFGNKAQFIAIQLQKRNPINIRSLLGIRKEINPKAMGLLLHAYCNIYRIFPTPNLENKIFEIVEWLAENYSKGYSGHCWGYNFVWAGKTKTLKKFHPSIVVTAFIGKGLFEYIKLTGNPKARELFLSSVKYITNDLPVTEDESGICFSYTDIIKDCCYNASMLGAEILVKASSLTANTEWDYMASRATDFVIKRQHKDGKWNYDIDIKTGAEKKQVDFHQGYVIDSIAEVYRYSKNKKPEYLVSINKGLAFYKSQQFYENGQSLWRWPRSFPVEIHNQSQGIISFMRNSDVNPAYQEFASRIADYTIDNMQDKNTGSFYYRKYKWFDNKIPFMRWSQCWMFLALTELLLASDRQDLSDLKESVR